MKMTILLLLSGCYLACVTIPALATQYVPACAPSVQVMMSCTSIENPPTIPGNWTCWGTNGNLPSGFYAASWDFKHASVPGLAVPLWFGTFATYTFKAASYNTQRQITKCIYKNNDTKTALTVSYVPTIAN